MIGGVETRLRKSASDPICRKFTRTSSGAHLPREPSTERKTEERIPQNVRQGLYISPKSGIIYARRLVMTNSEDRERLALVGEYVAGHIGEDMSIGGLARAAGMSPTKFKKLFREHFGTTVMGYVRAARMKTAEGLLAGSDHPVSVVAEMVGYEKQGAFAAAFKRQTGLLPSEYRSRRRGAKQGDFF
jgi:AraC-like DNA-binding protein